MTPAMNKKRTMTASTISENAHRGAMIVPEIRCCVDGQKTMRQRGSCYANDSGTVGEDISEGRKKVNQSKDRGGKRRLKEDRCNTSDKVAMRVGGHKMPYIKLKLPRMGSIFQFIQVHTQ